MVDEAHGGVVRPVRVFRLARAIFLTRVEVYAEAGRRCMSSVSVSTSVCRSLPGWRVRTAAIGFRMSVSASMFVPDVLSRVELVFLPNRGAAGRKFFPVFNSSLHLASLPPATGPGASVTHLQKSIQWGSIRCWYSCMENNIAVI